MVPAPEDKALGIGYAQLNLSPWLIIKNTVAKAKIG
jgi:hypothetical protein